MTNDPTMTTSNPDDEIAALTSSLNTTAPGPAAPTDPEIPGLNYVGCGYDVFGGFADDDSVKMALFDFSSDAYVSQLFRSEGFTAEQVAKAFITLPAQIKVAYSRPSKVMYKPLWRSQIDYQVTGSMQAEQQKLSANAGITADLGAFGGELKVRYDSQTSRLTTTKYYSATAVMRYFELTMDGFSGDLLHPERLPVIPKVRSDLDDESIAPTDIFNTYGTHYLWSVTMGCSIVYAHTVDTSKVDSKYDVSVEMRAKYEGIGVEGGTSNGSASQSERSFETIHILRKGLDNDAPGTDEHGGNGRNKDADALPLDILRGGWHDPVLIDLPKGALRPISELATTPARRAELNQALARYASRKGFFPTSAQQDLRPLYLLKLQDIDHAAYRLAPRTDAPKSWAGRWQWVDDAPPLYVFADQQPGTVALYEYYCDAPANGDFRYETSAYDAYLTWFDQRWKKSSGTPVGYVYDAVGAPDDAVDVYAYVPKDAGGHLRCYYSHDSDDSRDNGGWRPMVVMDDDRPALNRLSGNRIPVIALPVAGDRPNVHWRVPAQPIARGQNDNG